MFDLSRTSFSRTWEKPVATGQTVGTEGRVLQRVLSGGLEYVEYAAASGSLDIVGFSLLSLITPDEWPVVEEVTVPGSSPYTIQLAHGNLVPTMIRIYDVTTTSDLTEGNPANATEFSANDTTGLVTVNSARADDSLIIYYRYYPTVIEAKQMYFQNQVNRQSWSTYERVGVACGKCQIYTSEYDPTADYTTGVLNSAANGFVSIGGGTAIPNAHVISVPTASDPWLGIDCNI